MAYIRIYTFLILQILTRYISYSSTASILVRISCVVYDGNEWKEEIL